MNGYEKLEQLIHKEEEIREDLIGKKLNGKILWYEELELRHILWYCKIKKKSFPSIAMEHITGLFYYKTDYKLPLSSQDEVCEKIYNYLITL